MEPVEAHTRAYGDSHRQSGFVAQAARVIQETAAGAWM